MKTIVSPAQRKVLLNLLHGRKPDIHLSGGGNVKYMYNRTIHLMQRKGWLDAQDKLTEVGKEVAESLK